MITTIPSHEMEKVQKAMVRDSLTRAFDELHSGKVHHDARKLPHKWVEPVTIPLVY